MIKTNSLPIRKGILNHLKKLQAEIDALPSYKQQVKQAKILWQTKKKTNAQKAIFNRVEKELKKIAIGDAHYCNYCEANVGTTIEHVYPRGLYPNKTFIWENYLWTCKNCNGKHKISQFEIFATPTSAQTINLVKDYTFTPPPNDDAVFINPRVENPLHYLKLNLESGLFSVIEQNETTRAYKRAVYTLKVLQLNKRTELIKKRQQAYLKYINLLTQYIKVQQATSKEKLVCTPKQTMSNFSRYNLAEQKSYLSINTQKMLLHQAHPTVWKEMQRQSSNVPILSKLFQQVPETLNW